MGRKKIKQSDRKTRLIVYVKQKHLKKIAVEAQKIIDKIENKEYERSINSEKN